MICVILFICHIPFYFFSCEAILLIDNLGVFFFKLIPRIPFGPSSCLEATKRQISKTAEKTKVHSK